MTEKVVPSPSTLPTENFENVAMVTLIENQIQINKVNIKRSFETLKSFLVTFEAKKSVHEKFD